MFYLTYPLCTLVGICTFQLQLVSFRQSVYYFFFLFWGRSLQQGHPTKVGGSPEGDLYPSKNSFRIIPESPASPGLVIFLTH